MPSERLIATCIRDEANELVRAECRSLTGGVPDGHGVAWFGDSGDIGWVARSAYVRYGLRAIARGASLDELADAIQRVEFAADGFRIEIAKLPSSVVSTRREAVLRIAQALVSARPELDAPTHRFYVAASDTGLEFAEILTEIAHSYRKHDAKPYRTSSSLPSRIARAAVNLVAPRAQTVHDPCCGTGAIVMEACDVGLRATGADWNVRMVGMARGNLEHFGYTADVAVEDARDSVPLTDAVVTNLPYGKNLAAPEDEVRAILARTAAAVRVGVFIAARNMCDWLEEADFSDVEVYRVPKRAGFSRYVHRAIGARGDPSS